MKSHVLVASLAQVLAASIALAQTPPTKGQASAPAPQSRPSRPAGGQTRTPPAAPAMRYAPVGAREGAQEYRSQRNPPSVAGPGTAAMGTGSSPEPRYGVTRSAPGGQAPASQRPGGRPMSQGQFARRWNGHRYHAGAFRYPAGYGYRRFAVGQFLPFIFITDAEVFTDYEDLGLDAPPWDCEWVRYGPDLLLIDISTGEVVGVEYGVFD